jgi:hypothetical protein
VPQEDDRRSHCGRAEVRSALGIVLSLVEDPSASFRGSRLSPPSFPGS